MEVWICCTCYAVHAHAHLYWQAFLFEESGGIFLDLVLFRSGRVQVWVFSMCISFFLSFFLSSPGGSGFFFAFEDFGRECWTIHSQPAFLFLFFFKVISSRSLIPLFMPGSVHSGLASWDDCGWMFPDKLRVSSFPDRFPLYARTAASSAHSDFVGSRVYVCFDVTCYLRSWWNDRGFFLRATAVTRLWSGHRIRVSIQSWLRRRKFSRRSCWDSNSQPFDHESGALTNKLSRLKIKKIKLKIWGQPWFLFTVELHR